MQKIIRSIVIIGALLIPINSIKAEAVVICETGKFYNSIDSNAWLKIGQEKFENGIIHNSLDLLISSKDDFSIALCFNPLSEEALNAFIRATLELEKRYF